MMPSGGDEMILTSDAHSFFGLYTKDTCMLLGIHGLGLVTQFHYGPRIPFPVGDDAADAGDGLIERRRIRPYEAGSPELPPDFGSQGYPVQFSLAGGPDFRSPAGIVRNDRGEAVSHLEFRGYRVYRNPAELLAEFPRFADSAGRVFPHLRRTFGPEAGAAADDAAAEDAVEILALELARGQGGLKLSLLYFVFPQCDMIVRQVYLENDSGRAYSVSRMMSAVLSFGADGDEYELLTLDGTWGRERHLHRSPLRPGITSIGSTRGASGHRHSPWAAVARKGTGEHSGTATAGAMIYSGDFLIETEVWDDNSFTFLCGVHPGTSGFELSPGMAWITPPAAVTYSRNGLSGLSDNFHSFVKNRLLSPYWRTAPRPVVLNTWEAMYFSIDHDSILGIAKEAKKLGVELVVVDDGWFGTRNDDRTSLGDWFCNTEKLPRGLEGLARDIHDAGLKFGLWVEPEMVSVESDLYRAHPDWCLHVPSEPRMEFRNQLVLDFSREEVRRYITGRLTEILDGAHIDYIKWDMNRYMTQVGSAGGEYRESGSVSLAYMQGVYRVLEELTARYPGVLFEGCAGGGGRFDLGMIAYVPQYWTSDNTDPVSRLEIQHGTSMVFPPVVMSAHVAATPGHQVHRTTPLFFRSLVAMGGNYGLELDPRSLGAEEKAFLADEIAWYKWYRKHLHEGRYIRLENLAGSDSASWIVVSQDRGLAIAFRCTPFAEANVPGRFWKLAGLDEDASYALELHRSGDEGIRPVAEKPRRLYSGGELMHRGLFVEGSSRDFFGVRLVCSRERPETR